MIYLPNRRKAFRGGGGEAWSYTELVGSAFAASGASSWVDYDLYTNQSVPKGAVAEILCIVKAGASYDMGIRADGSAIDRYFKLAEGDAGGNASVHRMYVTCHASTGLIELYTGNTSNTEFRCVGYFEGLTFTEAWDKVEPGADAAWTDYDLYTNNSVPKGNVAVFSTCNNEGSANLLGVRINGSALDRYVNICSTGGTSYYGPATLAVKSDPNGVIEIYEADDSENDTYLQGYFSAGLDYVELSQSLTVGSDGWVSVDVGAYLDADGRLCEVQATNNTTGADVTLGVRGGDSGLDRYMAIRNVLTAGVRPMSANARSNSTGDIDCYTSANASSSHVLLGYFK